MNTLKDNAHRLNRKQRKNVLAWFRRHYPGEELEIVTGVAHQIDPSTTLFTGKTLTVLHVKNIHTNMTETLSVGGFE